MRAFDCAAAQPVALVALLITCQARLILHYTHICMYMRVICIPRSYFYTMQVAHGAKAREGKEEIWREHGILCISSSIFAQG